MSSNVLDASAVLAMLYEEPGAEKVATLLHHESNKPLISAVNFCEVHTRLLRDGLILEEALQLLTDLKLMVVSFGRRKRTKQDNWSVEQLPLACHWEIVLALGSHSIERPRFGLETESGRS